MLVPREKTCVLEMVTDPDELARGLAQHARFLRNSEWLDAHAAEVYANPENRGKFICVGGQELFVGDDALAVRELALSKHPEDDGAFVRWVPRVSLPRV